MKIYIGIDCGLDGAIVFLSSEGIQDMIEMPTKLQNGKRLIDIETLAQLFKKLHWDSIIEKSYQPSGRSYHKANPPIDLTSYYVVVEDPGPHAPSAAGLRSMTYSLAIIEALLVMCDFKYNLVMARKWQKLFWTRPKNIEGKFDTKAAALEAANIIWRNTDWRRTKRSKKAFDGFVDAALIAEYGRLCSQ